MIEHNIETQSRLLAKLLRELLASTRFESLADLTDALKARASRLHIRVTPDDISGAFRIVGSNLTLVEPPPTIEPVVPPPPFNSIPKAEAGQIYRALKARYQEEHPAIPLPSTDRPGHFPDLVTVPR